MNRTDLIADTLTMLRNANRVHKEKVDVPNSKMIKSILNILKQEGYIKDFKPLEETNTRSIRVYLKFDDENIPLINGLKRISKPSLRIYVDHTEIPNVLRGQGIAIISTPKGLLTDRQARDGRIGGEVVCYVW